VLLNAFTRALRDGFPPARVAGLKAIVATARYHSPEDAATRVLPAVGPLCVDAVHEVRASALACVEHFTEVLVAHNADLEKKAAALQASETADRSTAAAPGSSGGGSLLNSFGWAASSLGLGRSMAPTADAAAQKPAAVAPAAAPAATPAGGAGNSGSKPAAAAYSGSTAVDDLLEYDAAGEPGWGWCTEPWCMLGMVHRAMVYVGDGAQSGLKCNAQCCCL